MANVLQFLKYFTLKRKYFYIEGERVIFMHYFSCPKSSPTSFIIHGSNKEYYSLETLVFFLKNLSLQHEEYVQKAQEAEILPVKIQDVRPLVAYIYGEKVKCLSIDSEAPLAKHVRCHPSPTKRKADDQSTYVERKRQRTENAYYPKQDQLQCGERKSIRQPPSQPKQVQLQNEKLKSVRQPSSQPKVQLQNEKLKSVRQPPSQPIFSKEQPAKFQCMKNSSSKSVCAKKQGAELRHEQPTRPRYVITPQPLEPTRPRYVITPQPLQPTRPRYVITPQPLEPTRPRYIIPPQPLEPKHPQQQHKAQSETASYDTICMRRPLAAQLRDTLLLRQNLRNRAN